MLPDGKVKRKYKIRPLSECKVLIHDHHVGYITWEEYLKNQKTLEMNRSISTGNILHWPKRRLALLQGLVLCSRCGKTLRTRYKGNNGSYPTYECNRAPREDSTITYCGSLSAQAVDDIVIKRVLEILESDQLEITLSALEELEKRNAAIEKQWQMRIQRVSYEAQLAERRYKQVDPANRLVAVTLEQDWNNCLTQLEQIQKEHESFQKKEALTVTKEQREKILKLGTDLPKLWRAESTKYKDKKRILQLLIKDVTVERIDNELKLHIRWQGGIDETVETTLINRRGRHSYSPEFIEEIRRLADLMTDEEIVDKLNNENRLSQKKKPYTVSAITQMRRKYKITSVHLRRQGELSIKRGRKKVERTAVSGLLLVKKRIYKI